jgi:hypothetical protein
MFEKLPPWKKILPEKQIVFQLSTNSPSFMELVTVFARVPRWTASSAS